MVLECGVEQAGRIDEGSVRILIVDNYDSFTFNIFQIVARFTSLEPVVVRNDRVGLEDLARLDPDGVILSPGPGRPDRAEDFGVCGELLADPRFPTLGVCLGHQGIATAFGGSVKHAPEPMHGRSSLVSHDGSPLFDGVPQRFEVVRYHSLCVAEPLPPDLERIAWTDDGLVMALRHRHRPIWGVQFHPESIGTEHGERILHNFVELARTVSGRRASTSWPPSTKHVSVVPRAITETTSNVGYDLRYRALEGPWDTESAFVGLFAGEPLAFWLDSSRRESGEARFSFMGGPLGPLGETLRYDVAERALTVTRGEETVTLASTVWDYLDQELQRRRIPRSDALPFDFTCGYVGYLGYELKADGAGAAVHRSQNDDATLVFADRMLAFDHETQTAYLLALSAPDSVARAESDAWLDATEARLRSLHEASGFRLQASGLVDADVLEARSPKPGARSPEPIFRWARDPDRYARDVEECLRLIGDGESYEVCLTNPIHTETDVDPLTFYRTLRSSNPAPYAAFLRFGRLAIASSSPERFLKLDRQRTIEAKPIKGTAPRGPTPAEDAELAARLQTSEKTRAENLMIVDLLRNDLALVCDVGTVTVPRLMNVEAYATVHQLVTTVRGRVRDGLRAVDCVRAAFPGGSMTGAPKVRTMEIIDALETEARGVYSGAIGFFSLNETMDLSIVIRTAVFDDTRVSIGVGGAVVALSTPEEEVAEALLKARALVRALVVATTGPDGAEARVAEAEARLRNA